MEPPGNPGRFILDARSVRPYREMGIEHVSSLPDHGLERLQLCGAVLANRPLGPPDPGAGDRQSQPFHGVDGGLDLRLVGHVGRHEGTAQLIRQSGAPLLVQVGDGDPRSTSGKLACARLTEP